MSLLFVCLGVFTALILSIAIFAFVGRAICRSIGFGEDYKIVKKIINDIVDCNSNIEFTRSNSFLCGTKTKVINKDYYIEIDYDPHSTGHNLVSYLGDAERPDSSRLLARKIHTFIMKNFNKTTCQENWSTRRRETYIGSKETPPKHIMFKGFHKELIDNSVMGCFINYKESERLEEEFRNELYRKHGINPDL